MTEQERTLLIGTLSLLLSFALGYFVVRPQLRSYHTNQVALAARRIEIDALKERKIELGKLRDQLSRYQAQVDRLRLAVPADEQYPELVSQLSGLAQQSELILGSIQPTRNTQSDQFVVATVTIRGSFPQMVNFAERIEQNLRPARVQSLNLVENAEGARPDQLSGSLQIQFARIPGGVATGGVE